MFELVVERDKNEIINSYRNILIFVNEKKYLVKNNERLLIKTVEQNVEVYFKLDYIKSKVFKIQLEKNKLKIIKIEYFISIKNKIIFNTLLFANLIILPILLFFNIFTFPIIIITLITFLYFFIYATFLKKKYFKMKEYFE